MATLRIEQYAGAAMDNRTMMQMPMMPMVADAVDLTTSGSSQRSSKLDADTRALFIRSTGGKVAVTIGDAANVTVTALSGASLDDGEGRWFGVDPGAVQSSAGLAVAYIDRA